MEAGSWFGKMTEESDVASSNFCRYWFRSPFSMYSITMNGESELQTASKRTILSSLSLDMNLISFSNASRTEDLARGFSFLTATWMRTFFLLSSWLNLRSFRLTPIVSANITSPNSPIPSCFTSRILLAFISKGASDFFSGCGSA